MRKNTNKKIAVGALCALTAIGGFAFLAASDVADSTQTITAGTFDLDFENDETGISLTGTAPMQDEAGLALEGVRFDLHNVGTIDQLAKLGAVEISAGEDEDVFEIDNSLIKVSIDKIDVDGDSGEETVTEAGWFTGTLADLSEGDYGSTDTLDMGAGDVQSFRIRAWIDWNASNSDIYEYVEETDEIAKVGAVEFKLAFYGVQKLGGLDADVDWANAEAVFAG